MSTEHIFIGGVVPEFVRAKNGAVLFDKNNLADGDKVVVVNSPDESEVANKPIMSVTEGYKFLRDECESMLAAHKGSKRSELAAHEGSKRSENERQLDDIYAQINRDWMRCAIEGIRVKIAELFKDKMTEETEKGLEIALSALSLAEAGIK